MGEMIDGFEIMKAVRRDKRRKNLISSTFILERNNIHFEKKNNGLHLIVGGIFDFWPSTGLFVNRENSKRGRGIKNLIRELRA